MTFEEALPILNKLLELYRVRWTLKAVPYEDISQHVRLHAFKKWHLFDQKKDVRPWFARLIQRQMKNELRNEYYRFLPPCRKCPMFLGDDHCKMYRSLNSCSLYRTHQRTKRVKENMRFAISYETIEYDTQQNFSCDLTPVVQSIEKELHGTDKTIFCMFFESGMSITKIAQSLQESGVAFNKTFELVKISLDKTREIAKEVIEEQKSIMGFR